MDPILLGKGITDDVAVTLLPKLGNRHGLVAGATGTGKTVTLMTLAEGFSRLGVPVFLADVKGDVSGLAVPGTGAENLLQRAAEIGVVDYAPAASPTIFWDLYGKLGHPVRTTVSEMGPTLLSRILELNDTQAGVLDIVFAGRRPWPAAAGHGRSACPARPGGRGAQGHLHRVRPGQRAVDRRDPALGAAPGTGRRREFLRRTGTGTGRHHAGQS